MNGQYEGDRLRKMKKNQTHRNIAINLIAFTIHLGISLYTSPILIKALGTESYGFIGLANDFVHYLTIITTVFNSVASRFIAVEMAKGETKRAEKYFNSLFVTNLILGAVFLVFGVAVVLNVERIFDVPEYLISDVKVTFALTFGTFIVGVVTSIFTTATFVKNRLDISGARSILSYIIRLVCIVILLSLSVLHIYYIAIASLVAAVTVGAMNIGIKKRLMPEVRMAPGEASFKDVRILASAGVWLAITNMSSMLMRGLDLVVANKFLGSYDMGLLSVARTFPNAFSSAVSTLAPIFTPVFIGFWAKKQKDELVNSVKKSIRTMGLLMVVPVSGFIIFSKDFYTLWQKSYTKEEVMAIVILSTITVIQCYFNSATAAMAQMSVVVNKLKLPVLVSFGCGILNLICVFLLLSFTELGVYAIVIPSTVILILRYVLFNSLYCAHIISESPKPFLVSCVKVWITIPVQLGVIYLLKSLFATDHWMGLIIAAAVCGVSGYVIQFFLIEGKNSIKIIRQFLKR